MPDVRMQSLPKSRLNDLIALLGADGYQVIGPRVEDSAIVYGPITSSADLPIGWTDRQSPGSYRLKRRSDDVFFGFAVGPHSWKRYLFPPLVQLFHANRTENGFEIKSSAPDPPRRALLGVRACELHAIAIQDQVFIERGGKYTDPHYAAARARLFLIAVECESPAATCFCSSMATGPGVGAAGAFGECGDQAADGLALFDLALTELDDRFIARSGSDAGRAVLERLNLDSASDHQCSEARRRVEAASHSMRRGVDVSDLRDLLHRNQEHPRWDQVAERCLACANCTMVCPTCFCSSVSDTSDLSMDSAQRVRRWDSCFNPEFAEIHGGNFRPSIRGRYRQWLTHKFASWHDQFGTSGCVGCGRCITWCPVGIDVTEELTAIRTLDLKPQRGA